MPAGTSAGARNTGRPWTEDEDRLLRQAVDRYGDHDNWKTIATQIPGRTNKACRKRWLHSLSPTVKKSAWTTSEDQLLIQLHNTHGPKWSTIARQIPGRTDDACSKRYREALDPSLRKDEWTLEEDARLLEAHTRLGTHWGPIGHELQRSGLSCRNRWRLLERKRTSQRPQVDIPLSLPDFPESVPQPDAPTPLDFSIESPDMMPGFDMHPPDEAESLFLWPYYNYTPDTYVQYPFNSDPSFREPTPARFHSVPPTVAPFQFTSSSLADALVDLSPVQPPPPPVPPPQPPPVSCPDPPGTQSPLDGTQDAPRLDLQDDMHSPDHPLIEVHMQTEEMGSQTDELLELFRRTRFSSTPHSTPQHPPFDELQNTHETHDQFLRSPSAGPSNWDVLGYPSPAHPPSSVPSSVPSLGVETSTLDEFSSPASGSYSLVSPLSSTSSPNVAPPAELPAQDLSSTPTSLLFSGPGPQPAPPSELPTPSSLIAPIGGQLMQRKSKKPKSQPRLSSMLAPSPDSSVCAYACGRGGCWPDGASNSFACFRTSKELFDHNKAEHPNPGPDEKPFRCALMGCGKSWKSLNGLQYHLQLSTAHFSSALSSSFSAQSQQYQPQGSPLASTAQDLTSPPMNNDTPPPEVDDEAHRTWVCPRDGCFKAYRQSSGLRYHLKHGHPSDMPAQLSVVPPSLARRLPAKIKKMRPKAVPESEPS
ncbi:hypothetical protein BDN72DRAFT_829929 [Pluteus cervinus]|uniref:Uncharacterized protein n=1 Tax=Pluteus cervinus TaxID=181527 RepID=A0ACD3BFF3_9AGAR|nr:hypothetical protein BDN72DRAFT_829929 [Pluteus cervinus]